MTLEPPRGQLDLSGCSVEDVANLARDLYEIAIGILPEERHRGFAREVHAYLATGRRP